MSGSMRLCELGEEMKSECVGKVWFRMGLFGLSLMRLGSKYRMLWNVS
jgi:hypothetical protein